MKHWPELITEFIDTHAGNWKPDTERWYRDRFRRWLKFVGDRQLKPRQVTAADLNRFSGFLRGYTYGPGSKRLTPDLQAASERQPRKLAYRTRHGDIQAVKMLFRWLRRRRIIKQNPFDDPDYSPIRRERQVPKTISLAQAQKMIATAEAAGTLAALRDVALMRLLLTTGIRREEAVTLRRDRVDFEAARIVVTGKFDHERELPLKPATAEALKLWLARRPEPDYPLVFLSLSGSKRFTAMKPDNLNEILETWRERAGLPEISVSPHKWRRLFASEVALGGNPFALQKLMGHTDISTTNGYITTPPEVLRDLVERFAPDAD